MGRAVGEDDVGAEALEGDRLAGAFGSAVGEVVGRGAGEEQERAAVGPAGESGHEAVGGAVVLGRDADEPALHPEHVGEPGGGLVALVERGMVLTEDLDLAPRAVADDVDRALLAAVRGEREAVTVEVRPHRREEGMPPLGLEPAVGADDHELPVAGQPGRRDLAAVDRHPRTALDREDGQGRDASDRWSVLLDHAAPDAV